MPASIDPTTFKSSDFGRVKRRELRQPSVLALGGSSVTRRQLRKIQNSAAKRCINDAQGNIGRQMEPEWAETGFEPGFEPFLRARASIFSHAPSLPLYM